MDTFKLCSDGEFLPISLPCPPPYSGPYYYYPYENIPLPPEQGNTDYPVSSSNGGAPISSGAVAGIIIIIGFIFFIMCLIALKFRTRFIIGNIVRVSSRNARNNELSGEFLVSNGDMLVNIVGCGLEEKLVNLLPVCEYVGLMQEGKERHECAVCLSLFEEKEIVRVLPKCHHIFHLQCIDKWFESHANCPLCRERITLQTIQLSFNPDNKHDDQQPLHPVLPQEPFSHQHLNDPHVNSPPLRDAYVLHVNHQQDGRLACDLQDPHPHPNIFLSVASATSIINPHPAEAADQPVRHAAAGGHPIADGKKDTAFICSFEDPCDQNTILTPAVTAESKNYRHDAESKADSIPRNEAAIRETSAKGACALYIGDCQHAGPRLIGLQTLLDHSNRAAMSDQSVGASHGEEADDRTARTQRESSKAGLFVNPSKLQEAHAGEIEDQKTAAGTSSQAEESLLPIHGFDKALHKSAHELLLSIMNISSPHHPSTRPFSLMRKSLSTGCLMESDAKPSQYAFHGTTREML